MANLPAHEINDGKLLGEYLVELRSLLLCGCLLIVSGLPARSQNGDLVEGEHSHATAAHKIRSYHDRSIRDIQAIGERNVGCRRGFGNWYSLEQQTAMGKKYATRINVTTKFIDDPTITEYVNQIVQLLMRNSDSQVSLIARVIDSDEVTAVALPGGYLYVAAGLLLATDDEAELAGVLAHEIAHVAACHAARSRTHQELLRMISVPLMLVSGPVGYAAYQSFAVGTPFAVMKVSRNFELEADYLAIQYTYLAGYDPEALVAFFERIKTLDQSKQNLLIRALRSHPLTRRRIERVQSEIDTLLPAKAEYKVDTSEFQEMKARLREADVALRNYSALRQLPTLKRRPPPVEVQPAH
ncbi:MAG TPA: M48 family metalloprotease [Terriglobales bacterium]